MTYFAHDRFGHKILTPTNQQMEQLLASLEWAEVGDHPEVSLTHGSGWCISVYPSGNIILKHMGTNNEPWHMHGVSKERAKELWQLLAAGRLDELGGVGWLPGYGA